MTELRRFSHSLVETFLDCPRKAMYRYVEEVPSPKSPALVKGSAMDVAANAHLERKMRDGEGLTLEDTLQAADEAFGEETKGEVDWGESNRMIERDAALKLTRTWHQQLAPEIWPAAVQTEYHRPFPSGRDFIGRIDWEGSVDDIPVFGDNKTGSRRMSEGDATKALQPSAYAYVTGRDLSFVFARAIDTGKSQYSEFVFTGRSLADIDWYAGLLDQVEQSFVAGIFPPNPRSTLCGPRYCPFFQRCQPHRSVSGPGKD